MSPIKRSAIIWRLAIALTIVASYLLLPAHTAFACSCLPPGPPAAALAEADAVFAGQVTTIEDSLSLFGSSADPVAVTIKVNEVWKGDLSETVIVTTAESSASCGFDFAVGQAYLVYAHETETGELAASLCSRTTALTDATVDLAALGAGQSPDSGGAGTPGDGGTLSLPSTLTLVLSTIGLATVFTTIAIRSRRRAR